MYSIYNQRSITTEFDHVRCLSRETMANMTSTAPIAEVFSEQLHHAQTAYNLKHHVLLLLLLQGNGKDQSSVHRLQCN